MITRVFRGRSAYGLVRYLYGEGRRNEHTDAHMVASWDGNPAALEPQWLETAGVYAVAPLARTLEQPVRVCERADKTKHVYHLVLRTAPEDRRLTDAEWAEVATAAMDAAGVAPVGDPAACRWVAVRHAEDHLHVVATLAREDGRVPRIHDDWKRIAQVARHYEEKFGLAVIAGRADRTASPRPGVKEQVTAENAGRRQAPRVTLRRKVQAAVAGSHDFAEFTVRLAGEGVSVWPRMSERDPGQITGYSVSLDDWTNAAGEPVRFGGGKLAPDLSWPKLQARWAPATSADAHASAHGAARGQSASSTTSDAAPGRAGSDARERPRAPLSGEDADRVWREAERIVREAADQIRADAATDPAAGADAAWAASDTLAAAAAGVEGDAGGPITDAAAAFERAGRELNRKTPPASDTGTALRATARMVALLTAGNQHPAARVAALTIALASLTAAVADLRVAQQRGYQAAAARAAAEQLVSVAPAPAPVPRPARSAEPSRARTAADVAGLSTGGARFRPSAPKRPTQPPAPGTPGRERPGQRRDPRQDGTGRGL